MRLYLKLAQVYGFIHDLSYFPNGVFMMQPHYSSRFYKIDTIHGPFAQPNYFYHSFVPNSIRIWNSLEPCTFWIPPLFQVFFSSSIANFTNCTGNWFTYVSSIIYYNYYILLINLGVPTRFGTCFCISFVL